MKKRTEYMSDETFSELKESFEQVLQHVRGERNDLRKTVVPVPPRADAESATAGSSIKMLIVRELEGFNEARLRKVAEFIAFLKFQERFDPFPTNDEKEKSLEELLAGITEENLHPEIDFGPPVGKEVW